MSLNSDFDALSDEWLLVQIFQVVRKLVSGFWTPAWGTNLTKIGQEAEG